MSKTTTFMIAAGASVVVVRDGKRKTIQPGGGDDFTDAEITYINAAQPGALRRPINEGSAKAAVAAAATEDAEDAETKAPAKKKAAAKPAAEAKPAKAKADDAEDDDI